MIPPILLLAALLQTTPAAAPAPHHEINFEAERQQAETLFTAGNLAEALPLYLDLDRQDPTVALFAERTGACLFAKEATMPQDNARLQTHLQAVKELRRAAALGDNSSYVRTALNAESKSFVGAVIAGIPLTVGYTYHGKPEAQAAFELGNKAFHTADYATAVEAYKSAATLDPDWYDAALFTGDTYIHLKDWNNTGLYFAKAIKIDPDRETAYRYWGDMLYNTGSPVTARQEYVEAVVAEPYGNEAFNRLSQWCQHTKHQMVTPAIKRPEFITPNGELKIDPALEASTADGRSSWIVYQQYRVAHGARVLNQVIIGGGIDKNAVVTPSGYRHSIEEEHAALRAMLADVDAKIKAGTLDATKLDVSIDTIRKLEAQNVLGAWICINAADAGIRADYPAYRAKHRKHLYSYVYNYLIRDTPPAS